MREDLVKKIFYKYLTEFLKKEIKIKSTHAAGPDFVVEGDAYECKGSKFPAERLIRQLISYASEYKELNLVLPYDALNFILIHQLEAIEYFIRRKEYPNTERALTIYLVSEEGSSKYAIGKWSYARSLVNEISSIFYQKIPKFLNLPVIQKDNRILDFINKNKIQDNVHEGFKLRILEKAQKAQTERTYYEGAFVEIKNSQESKRIIRKSHSKKSGN
jgi:hypothetical protein